MAPHNHRFMHRHGLIVGLSSLSLFACAPPDRSFNDKPEHGVGGAAAGGSSTAGGATSTAGKSNVGGSTNGGVAASGGTSSNGGVVGVGGTLTNGGVDTSAGTSSMGGASAAGGAVALGGTSASIGGATNIGGKSSVGGGSPSGGSQTVGGQAPIGGSASVGGATIGVGGSSNSAGGSVAVGGSKPTGGAGGATLGAGGATISTGGQPLATGGTPGATGGVSPTGGVPATGGAKPTGGNAGTGGTTVSNCTVTETQEVSCGDGVDNDCDGAIDCPVVGGRYPAPGIAAPGDDVWVRLNAPGASSLKVQSMQCRFGKPAAIASIAWAPCIVDATDTQKVYSMSGADAQLKTNDGVTQFDFRFQYTSGAFSEPRSIVYYAHSSLWDGSPTVSKFACKPIVGDDTLFAAAQAKLVTSSSQAGFAATDVQLKNPFVSIQFTPPFLFGHMLGTAPLSTPQKINVMSLRHRFVVDPTRQLLLVARMYQSQRNAPSCLAASLQTREYATGARVRLHPEQYNNHCDAVVLNKFGSGVCLVVSTTGNISIPDIHSGTMTAIMQTIRIKWPNVEATMWQKLFDDRAGRSTLQYFSDKCITGDTACLTTHKFAVTVPDTGDPYFTTP